MIHWEQFDRIYLISLADRPERRKYAVKQLDRFFGNNLPQFEVFNAIRPTEAAGFPSVGARGCFLSHLEVLKQSLIAGYQRILVLEDDIRFDLSMQDTEVPTAWDWLYLGHRIEATTPARFERWSGAVETSHCYAIGAGVLKQLVPYLEAILLRPPGDPAGGPMHVDGAFSRFRGLMPQFATWIAMPSICSQASFTSDIATKQWFDRTPVLRSLAASARVLKRSRLFPTTR
jgi:hypothetical protein